MHQDVMDASGTQVPIWFGTNCKHVCGVKKSTTCQDVIRSVAQSDDTTKFVMVEKWKRMERKLEPHDKILKVWKAWGNQRNEVSFVLRSLSNDGYIDKKVSHKAFRRKSSSHHYHRSMGAHGREDEEDKKEPLERLLKLVLTQGETIQAQLKKLRHQEEQIERYEEEMHKIRSLKDGENYVLDSYLTEDSKGESKRLKKKDKSTRKSTKWSKRFNHGTQAIDNEGSTSYDRDADGDDQGCSNFPIWNDDFVTKQLSPCALYETEKGTASRLHDSIHIGEHSNEQPTSIVQLLQQICDLNSKLTKEEEQLVKLGLKVEKINRKCKEGKNRKMAERVEQDEEDENDNMEEGEDEDDNGCEVVAKELLSELHRLKVSNDEQSEEIKTNELNLNEMENVLDMKHDYVTYLNEQIEILEEHNSLLEKRLVDIKSFSSPSNFGLSGDPQVEKSDHALNDGTLAEANSENAAMMNDSSNRERVWQGSNLVPGYCDQPTCTPSTSQSSQAMPMKINHSNLSIASNMVSNVATNVASNVVSSMVPNVVCNVVPIKSISCQSSATNPNRIVSFDKSSGDGGGRPNAHAPRPHPSPATPNIVLLHNKQCAKDHQDNDSNSDTGISSLHSNGDEQSAYVLDTLV